MTRLVPFLVAGIIGLGWAGVSPAEETAGLAQALIEAGYEGSLEKVRQLVSQGVPVDATDDQKRTALMWTSFNGHKEVAVYLLESGAKVDAKDLSGRTALLYASSGPFAPTVELLLDRGADPNTQGTLEGFTALMTAAAEGQLDVARLLLSRGADPSVKDEDGDTAISFALEKGHPEVAELLREAARRSE